MKKSLFITFCLLAMALGCSKPDSVKVNDDDELNGCNPVKKTYTWSTDKKVVLYCCDTTYTNQSADPYVRHFAAVTEGSNIVFTYTYYSPQCDYIDDDEVAERLTFEIDKNLNEFEYVDSEISATNCFYSRYCFCQVRGASMVKSGVISGKRISGSGWVIRVCVVVSYPHHPGIEDFDPKTFDFTATFTKD